MAHLLI